MLLTSSPLAKECASRLRNCCDEQVHVVNSMRAAMAQVRTSDFSVIVIDQNLLDPDPLAADTLLRNAGMAIPVYVNFALCNADRVWREVDVALRRSQTERLAATRAAAKELRSELNGALTGILMSSELALQVPALPEAAQAKLRSVHELAETIRRQLEASA